MDSERACNSLELKNQIIISSVCVIEQTPLACKTYDKSELSLINVMCTCTKCTGTACPENIMLSLPT